MSYGFGLPVLPGLVLGRCCGSLFKIVRVWLLLWVKVVKRWSIHVVKPWLHESKDISTSSKFTSASLRCEEVRDKWNPFSIVNQLVVSD
jgi:hypothetical protein